MALQKLDLFTSEVILENNRVKLVPFSEKYEADLHKIIFDEELFNVNCKTDADFERYMKTTLKQKNEFMAYPFIIIDKQTNEVAGSTRYGHLFFDNKRLEIGWTWYGRKFRGTGLNKACKFELLNYAFDTMDFRRVQLSADVDNIRSQKAIAKLGATREGIFRANYINSSGESRDDVYFSIVKSEWAALKHTVFSEFAVNALGSSTRNEVM
jgi:RimJ/RimL family protein N-acetyltransferase